MEDAGENGEIILQGVANLRMEMNNLHLDQMGNRKRAQVGLAVQMVGNWVGGRYRLTRRGLHFEMNAMNKRYQADTGPVFIPLDAITGVALGTMFLFFPTVDISTETGLVRLRAAPGKSRRLFSELRQLCNL